MELFLHDLLMKTMLTSHIASACNICRYFPLDTAALISKSDYIKGMQLLKQHSADPWHQSKHLSSKHLNDDKFRHRRVLQDPQRCFQRPMMSQQVTFQRHSLPCLQA